MKSPVIFIIVLSCLFSISLAQGPCSVSNSSKIDCGYSGIDQDGCNSKGCCWVPAGQGSSIPWCFYGTNYSTSVPLPPPSIPGAPFSSSELSTMYDYFIANIDIQNLGGVVASPDNSTPGGSYYYHWERDGALTMNALQLVTSFSNYNSYMQSYVNWVLNVQNEPDPNGIDVRIEPKYNLPYGDVFSDPWCRPQTDGPGLRALTLLNYANTLLEEGDYSDYISEYLWTGSSNVYNGGAIKFDLDWIVDNWQQNGCDLWEEIENNDFFWNRFTMKASLYLGSNFAAKMGDTSSSISYFNTANAINATLINHWNGEFIFESTNREEDAAVILGFNNGYSDDGFLSPTDPRVTATINTLNTLFYFSFPINTADSEAGVPGILYGRYEGDTYAGGNPWILTSASLAQLFYRGATDFVGQNIKPHPSSLADWQQIFLRINREYHTIRKLKQLSSLEFSQLVTSAGDAVLDRIRYHTEADNFHLSEQLDKNTGDEASATDLTWSYATVLKAMWHRNNATTTTLAKYPHLKYEPFYQLVNWI